MKEKTKNIIRIVTLIIIVAVILTGVFKSNHKVTQNADEYYQDLNYFLVQFKLMLNQLDLPQGEDINPKIDKVFNINNIHGEININKIDHEIVKIIFTEYDFSKPSLMTLENGYRPSTGSWFIEEIRSLKKKCDKNLDRYSDSGDPKLIRNIKLMHDSIENVEIMYSMNGELKFCLGHLNVFFHRLKVSLKRL